MKPLEELLREASPLPWVNGTRNEHGVIRSPDHGLVAQAGPFPRQDDDAALIVAAVNALPLHLEAVKALERLVDHGTSSRPWMFDEARRILKEIEDHDV